jgi:hypothetical protein
LSLSFIGFVLLAFSIGGGDGGVKAAAYFLAGFWAFAGGAGSFLGRPMRTLRSISSTSGSYMASLVMGCIPAVSIRFRVASTEIFNSLASSETVIPSIPLLSDILQGKIKNVSKMIEILLDKVSKQLDT